MSYSGRQLLHAPDEQIPVQHSASVPQDCRSGRQATHIPSRHAPEQHSPWSAHAEPSSLQATHVVDSGSHQYPSQHSAGSTHVSGLAHCAATGNDRETSAASAATVAARIRRRSTPVPNVRVNLSKRRSSINAAHHVRHGPVCATYARPTCASSLPGRTTAQVFAQHGDLRIEEQGTGRLSCHPDHLSQPDPDSDLVVNVRCRRLKVGDTAG